MGTLHWCPHCLCTWSRLRGVNLRPLLLISTNHSSNDLHLSSWFGHMKELGRPAPSPACASLSHLRSSIQALVPSSSLPSVPCPSPSRRIPGLTPAPSSHSSLDYLYQIDRGVWSITHLHRIFRSCVLRALTDVSLPRDQELSENKGVSPADWEHREGKPTTTSFPSSDGSLRQVAQGSAAPGAADQRQICVWSVGRRIWKSGEKGWVLYSILGGH